jgi:NADH dehydrogenase FAD-containing subunit
MGGVCAGRDSADDPVLLPTGAAVDKLTATQRACLDSWTALLDGQTEVARAAPKGTAPATLFYDAFYADLTRRSPATAAFFAFGGIPRKARALMRMVASLLTLGGKTGAALAKEHEELASIAAKHAYAHGVGPAHYEPYLDALQHALAQQLGRGMDGGGWTPDVAAAWKAQCEYALNCMLPVARIADRPLVVIIGGGFAGWSLAKALDEADLHRVLLIERKGFLLFSVGGLRAAVRAPDYVDSVLLPTRGSLKHTTILPADVLEIRPDGVRVHGRESLVRFDVCVIATGSSYAFPGKIASTRREEIMAAYTQCAANIKAAERIVVCGGGPVGVELAGEIGCFYRGEGVADSAGPRKKVIVVQRASRLVPTVGPEVHDAAVAHLERLGVEVLTDQEVVLDDEDEDRLGRQSSLVLRPKHDSNNKPVRLRSGKTIEDVDLLFMCKGTSINSASYENTFAGSMNEQKQLIVNEYLQVRDPSSSIVEGSEDESVAAAGSALEGADPSPPAKFLPHVFAIGDCASADANMAIPAGNQARYLAEFFVWQVKRAQEKAQHVQQLAAEREKEKTKISRALTPSHSPPAGSAGDGKGAAYRVTLRHTTSASLESPSSPTAGPVSTAAVAALLPSVAESSSTFAPYKSSAAQSVQDLVLCVGQCFGVHYSAAPGPGLPPSTVTWKDTEEPTEAAEIMKQAWAKFKAQDLFVSKWVGAGKIPKQTAVSRVAFPSRFASLFVLTCFVHFLFCVLFRFQWELIGHPYAKRAEVDWSNPADLVSAEDVRALALSMQVSHSHAKQLLMQNAAIMHRDSNVLYT